MHCAALQGTGRTCDGTCTGRTAHNCCAKHGMHAHSFSGSLRSLYAGGGFGATTRWAGLGGDNLISLTAVDGKGRILRADHTKNSDL